MLVALLLAATPVSAMDIVRPPVSGPRQRGKPDCTKLPPMSKPCPGLPPMVR